jgi:hypothetical protein
MPLCNIVSSSCICSHSVVASQQCCYTILPCNYYSTNIRVNISYSSVVAFRILGSRSTQACNNNHMYANSQFHVSHIHKYNCALICDCIGAKKRAAEEMSDDTKATTAKKPVKRAKCATAAATAAKSKAKEQSAPAKKATKARAKSSNGNAKANSKPIAAAKAKPLASKQKKAPAAKKPATKKNGKLTCYYCC